MLLDAGTTTARLAALLPADRELTVVTNAVPIAARLAGMPRSPCTCSPAGSAAPPRPPSASRRCAVLGTLRVDVAFIGTNGISVRPRPDHPRPRRGGGQARRWSAAPKVVVAADSSKIGQEDWSASPRSPASTCSSPTPGSATPTAPQLTAAGVEVVVA